MTSGFSGTFTVNDAEAGLCNGTLTFDHSVGTDQEINCGTGGTFTVTGVNDDADGTITVTLAMRDNVGNIGTDSLVIRFDNTVPIISNDGWWENNDFMYTDSNKKNLWFSDLMKASGVNIKIVGSSTDNGAGLQKAVFSNEPSLAENHSGDDSTPADWMVGYYNIINASTATDSPAIVTIYDNVGNFATVAYNYYEDLEFKGTITVNTADNLWFATLTPTVDVDFSEELGLGSGWYGVNGTTNLQQIFSDVSGTSVTDNFKMGTLNEGTNTVYFKVTNN
ncbi:MAG: hypothetical protein V1749_03775 [Candidatus Desantisbacteria bacterium]